MKSKSLFAVAALAAIAGSLAFAQPEKKATPAAQPATKATPAQPDKKAAQPGADQLPPGMNPEDMAACMAAATPGEQHKFLAKGVGTWTGKCLMWMAPDTEPTKSECTSTVTSIMDGRFVKVENAGEIPGMGPFHGFGINGFDNVSKKFQSTWIDNCGTGMMTGTGELSSDGSTLTWKYNYNCPILKKPAVMREVEKYTGNDTMTLTMYMNEPHSGKEYKMMEISFTRKAGTANASTAK